MRHILRLAAFSGVLGSTFEAFGSTKPAIDLRSQGTLTLAVYGDSPYGTSPTDTTQNNLTLAFIQAINNDSLVDLVVHSGTSIPASSTAPWRTMRRFTISGRPSRRRSFTRRGTTSGPIATRRARVAAHTIRRRGKSIMYAMRTAIP